MYDGFTYHLVNVFEGDDHFDAEVFHERSKLTRHSVATLSRRIDAIKSDPHLQRMMWRAWKTYEGAERIPLPPASLGQATLEETMLRRRSQTGKFAGGPITFAQLAAILRFTYGPTIEIASRKFPGEGFYLRATPSGGGLYPLEIYPIVFDVDGCDPGIYHYSVKDYALEVLRRGPCLDRFLDCTSYHDLATTASVVFAITAVMPRTLSKYLFRGYRFLSYDVGACVQSFYLSSAALGLGCCALGGFYDDRCGRLLDVDNVTENVMMLFTVGQVPGIIASVLYAIVPGIRITALGIRQVPQESIEASQTFGATKRQTMFGVRIPLAAPTIMAAVNQVIMMVLAMVIIAGLVGGGALGFETVRAVTRGETGLGFEVGLAIVVMAIILDRLTQAWAARLQPPSGH